MLGVRYCFVTGEISFPPSPGMGPHTIRYAEFTIPGLSYHRGHESQLDQVCWSLELTLLIPVMLLLAIFGHVRPRFGRVAGLPVPAREPTAR